MRIKKGIKHYVWHFCFKMSEYNNFVDLSTFFQHFKLREILFSFTATVCFIWWPAVLSHMTQVINLTWVKLKYYLIYEHFLVYVTSDRFASKLKWLHGTRIRLVTFYEFLNVNKSHDKMKTNNTLILITSVVCVSKTFLGQVKWNRSVSQVQSSPFSSQVLVNSAVHHRAEIQRQMTAHTHIHTYG